MNITKDAAIHTDLLPLKTFTILSKGTLNEPDTGVYGRGFKDGAWPLVLLVTCFCSVELLWKTFHTTSRGWKRHSDVRQVVYTSLGAQEPVLLLKKAVLS